MTENRKPDSILSMAGKKGAHRSWANTANRTERTAAARNGLEARFLQEAGGDTVKADSIRKAYFADLALRSAQARRARKAAS